MEKWESKCSNDAEIKSQSAGIIYSFLLEIREEKLIWKVKEGQINLGKREPTLNDIIDFVIRISPKEWETFVSEPNKPGYNSLESLLNNNHGEFYGNAIIMAQYLAVTQRIFELAQGNKGCLFHKQYHRNLEIISGHYAKVQTDEWLLNIYYEESGLLD